MPNWTDHMKNFEMKSSETWQAIDDAIQHLYEMILKTQAELDNAIEERKSFNDIYFSSIEHRLENLEGEGVREREGEPD